MLPVSERWYSFCYFPANISWLADCQELPVWQKVSYIVSDGTTSITTCKFFSHCYLCWCNECQDGRDFTVCLVAFFFRLPFFFFFFCKEVPNSNLGACSCKSLYLAALIMLRFGSFNFNKMFQFHLVAFPLWPRFGKKDVGATVCFTASWIYLKLEPKIRTH